MAIIASITAVTPAFADLANPNCLELGNCPIDFTAPLEWMIFPLEYQMGPILHLLVWGSIILIVQLKGQNPALTGIVGLVILAGFTGSQVLVNSDTAQFIFWGEIALVVGIGCMIFYLVFIKLRSGF